MEAVGRQRALHIIELPKNAPERQNLAKPIRDLRLGGAGLCIVGAVTLSVPVPWGDSAGGSVGAISRAAQRRRPRRGLDIRRLPDQPDPTVCYRRFIYQSHGGILINKPSVANRWIGLLGAGRSSLLADQAEADEDMFNLFAPSQSGILDLAAPAYV